MVLDIVSLVAAGVLSAATGQASDKCCGDMQVAKCDRTTSALSLGAGAFNRIDVAPLLAQRPLRVGVDDARREGFNGKAWNGDVPSAGTDCYAAAYGAAGQEGTVILVHAGPRHIVALNPFAPVERFTADGQRMSPDVVRVLEAKRSQWLNEHGFTGGVRTFSNPAAKPAEKKEASEIKPRAIIELNPEVTRFKSRMQVQAPARKAPVVAGVFTTAAPASVASKEAPKAEPTTKAQPAAESRPSKVVKVAIAVPANARIAND